MMVSRIDYLAETLVSNQPLEREKGLRKLAKWLETVSVSQRELSLLTEELLLKLWNSVFYYFWHCDKMLVQEDRAEKISKFLHNIQNEDFLMSFIGIFFKTMSKEWSGIDRYRIEKFMMLVRKFLHEAFIHLKNKDWRSENIQSFLNVLKETCIGTTCVDTTPFGLRSHVCEIYMEELARTGADDLSAEALEDFLKPFCEILSECTEDVYLTCIKRDVFLYLVNQDAEAGPEHEDFPVLKFDAVNIKNLLLSSCKSPNLRRRNMKLIHSIIKRYEDFLNDVCAEDKIFNDKPVKRLRKRVIEKATEALLQEDEEILREKLEMKKQRRPKRKYIDL